MSTIDNILSMDWVEDATTRVDLMSFRVNTKDIIGNDTGCIASNFPEIPLIPENESGEYPYVRLFTSPRHRYSSTFLPHIAVAGRYEVNAAFSEFYCDLLRDLPQGTDARCIPQSVALATAMRPWNCAELNGVSALNSDEHQIEFSAYISYQLSYAPTMSDDEENFDGPSIYNSIRCHDFVAVIVPSNHVKTLIQDYQKNHRGKKGNYLSDHPIYAFAAVVTSCEHNVVHLKAYIHEAGLLDTAQVVSQMVESQHEMNAEVCYLKRLSSSCPTWRLMKAVAEAPDRAYFKIIQNPKRHIAIPTEAIEKAKKSSTKVGNVELDVRGLDKEQKMAVASVVQMYDKVFKTKDCSIALVDGPPGTGKTTTILGMIKSLQNYNSDMKIVVVTPSNAATDEVCFRMAEGMDAKHTLSNPLLLRTGIASSVSSQVREYKKNHSLFVDDFIVEKWVAEGIISKDCLPESREDWYKVTEPKKKQMEKYREDLLNRARIVMTTVGSLWKLMSILRRNPDVIIVDEAGKVSEPESVLVLNLCPKMCVLVGDPRQLQPTVLCHESSAKGMQRSLMERLQTCGWPSVQLTKQFRMHKTICQFPNERYYNNILRTGQMKDSRKVYGTPLALLPRVIAIDVEGEMKRARFISRENEIEARAVVATIKSFLDVQTPKFTSADIGVITFYKGQVDLINEKLSTEKFGRGVEVRTVDSFQGREKPIIIISCVRQVASSVLSGGDKTAEYGILGFLCNKHRLNVSLTRARDFLVVIGDLSTFERAMNERPEEGSLVTAADADASALFHLYDAGIKRSQAMKNAVDASIATNEPRACDKYPVCVNYSQRLNVTSLSSLAEHLIFTRTACNMESSASSCELTDTTETTPTEDPTVAPEAAPKVTKAAKTPKASIAPKPNCPGGNVIQKTTKKRR